MANDNDPWKRFRDKDENEDEDDLAPIPKRSLAIQPSSESDTSSDSIESLIEKAETLIERTNALYQMWLNGAEKRAPLEVKAQLDTTIRRLKNFQLSGHSSKFKVGTLLSRYRSYSDRWDRIIRIKETA